MRAIVSTKGKNVRLTVTCMTILALLFAVSPASTLAATATQARLEGIIVGIDGRPAAGHTVHLISEDGTDLAQTPTDEKGIYSFTELPAGSYALAIETAQGVVAPVDAPPVSLSGGELARRDIKLLEADPASRDQAAQANYGMGMWWAGLSTGARAGVIIGSIFVVWGLVELFSSDDDPVEPVPTPF